MISHCQYCEKKFEKASTHIRHEYYCASKLGKPQVPRRRACTRCIRAKARCDQDRPRCGRCESRNSECVYDSNGSAISRQTRNVKSPPSSKGGVDLPLTPRGNASGTSLRLAASPFSFKTDSAALPGVSIILKSLLHVVADGTRYPPFIHSMQPRSVSIETCQDILQAHFNHGSRQTTWELIKREHERIWFSYQSFSSWELLSSFQALVIYCLFRTTFDGAFDLDLPLLLSLKEVIVRLATLHGMQYLDLNDTSDRAMLGFEQWVFDESRRRTVIIFRILNLITDLSDAIPCSPKPPFVIAPLPSKDLLWQARTASDWELPFISQEYAVHGMTEDGELLKLSSTFDGIVSSKRSWESWCAEMGEIGVLLALTAQVLY